MVCIISTSDSIGLQSKVAFLEDPKNSAVVPVPEVVIFSTPSPESIRKAVDLPKLFHC